MIVNHSSNNDQTFLHACSASFVGVLLLLGEAYTWPSGDVNPRVKSISRHLKENLDL